MDIRMGKRKNIMTDKYWMVLRSPEVANGNVDHQHRPRFVHVTRESAEKEAERLSVKHKDSFLILEGCAWVHPKPASLPGIPGTVPSYEILPA